MPSAVGGGVLWAMLTVAAASAQAPVSSGDAAEAKEITAEDVIVRYRAIPWDASRLAVVTAPAPASSSPVLLLPLGQLELKSAMRLDGERLEAGHYGILCHGSLTPGARPVLRLVRLPDRTLFDSGEMADLGRVELTSRPPIRFELARGTTPALRINLAPTKRGVTLTVEYGNRRAVAVFRR